MPRVLLTPNLARVLPGLGGLTELEVDGATAAEVVAALDARFPGLAAYVVDERGRLRKHVNLFVEGEMVRDRATLADPVPADGTVHLIQALSGG